MTGNSAGPRLDSQESQDSYPGPAPFSGLCPRPRVTGWPGGRWVRAPRPRERAGDPMLSCLRPGAGVRLPQTPVLSGARPCHLGTGAELPADG